MASSAVPSEAGQHGVHGGAEGAKQAQGPADFRVPRIGRDAEHAGLGQFPRAVGELDPGAAGVRRDDLAGNPEFGGEIGYRGGAGGE